MADGGVVERWRGDAFGMALDSAFPFAGCPSTTPLNRRRRLRLELADSTALEAMLSPTGWTVIFDQPGPRRRSALRVEHHRRDGYVLRSGVFGLYHVSARAAVVRCAPVDVAPWRWQRHVVGQVLPLVATLRGLEPFHASAVAVGGAAIAILGPSGLGKSSLAAELVLGGAALVADDVIALEVDGPRVLAHPALGLMMVRRSTASAMGLRKLRQLGTRVGANRQAVRVAVKTAAQPLPLVACYFLERTARSSPRLTPITPDPRRVLGSSFVAILASTERLARHFEVSVLLASTARTVRVEIPAAPDFAAIASSLRADAERAVGVAAPA